MYVRFVDKLGDDLRVVNAARISFDSSSERLSEKDTKLIKYLADHEHMSPFEHNALSVEIKCPLFISKQIMRHRTFAFNEVSRRYTSETIEFYYPQVWRKQSASNRQASDGVFDDAACADINEEVSEFHLEAVALYDRLIKRGVAREMARGVLPQNLYTKFLATANLRNWVHFVKLRDHAGAQLEIQYIAQEVKKLLDEHFPVATKALLGDNRE